MTAREPVHEAGARLAFTHKGESYVGRLVKSQRRAAVLEHKGKRFTVPWTAIKGQLDGRKGPAHREGRMA